MQTPLLISRLTIAFGLIINAFSFTAHAQEFPSRTMQVIVPFTAGGPTDAMARVVGRELSRLTGQPVVVENRPGAGGAVGAGGYWLGTRSRPHPADGSVASASRSGRSTRVGSGPR